MKFWQVVAVVAASLIAVFGLFTWASYAGAATDAHAIVKVTTNDRKSLTEFWENMGYEPWGPPGARGQRDFDTVCRTRLGDSYSFLGQFTRPAPNAGGKITWFCISSDPTPKKEQAELCMISSLWKDAPYVLFHVSDDGYTVSCALAWMKKT